MTNSNALLLSIKVILMSTGAVFIATLLTPHAFNLPALWSSLCSWLRPPYLYVIINGIIITIAASSRLLHSHHPTSSPDDFHRSSAAAVEPSYSSDHSEMVGSYDSIPAPVRSGSDAPHGSLFVRNKVEVEDEMSLFEMIEVANTIPDGLLVGGNGEKVKEVQAVITSCNDDKQACDMIRDDEIGSAGGDDAGGDITEEDTTLIGRSTWKPAVAPLMRQESVETSSSETEERPPASARFGQHRRPSRLSTEGGSGKALKVAKSRRNGTLEQTWKTITEGRHMPLTRRLRKSDMWDNRARQSGQSDKSPPLASKKPATSRDRSNYSKPAAATTTWQLRKEPSLSQDELNRRVEAFINKFNEGIRLERQQSMQQFMEMINRAAY